VYNEIDLSYITDEKELENVIYELQNMWYTWESIWQGEWRIVYNFWEWYNLNLVMKEVNNNNRIKDVTYQNFVENYIYNNSRQDIKDNLLWKVYCADINTNNCVIMEKCDILDEDAFTWIDLRDTDDYNKFIIDNKNINKIELDNRIKEICEDYVNNFYWYNNFENIINKDLYIWVTKLFIWYNFIDEIDEYGSENDLDLSELKNNIEIYLEENIPNELQYLIDYYNFSIYDLSLCFQWWFSDENKFKLIDYWMWLKSYDFYKNHNYE